MLREIAAHLPLSRAEEATEQQRFTGLGFGTLAVVFLGLIGVAVAFRLYQGEYAWTAGIDSTSSDFRTYWRNLWLFNIFALGGLSTVWWGWGLMGCRTCDVMRAEAGRVHPWHELRHISLTWVHTGVLTFSSLMALALAAEQDAAWHQVVVRDTAITPSHVVLFWFWAPLFVVSSIAGYLYARSRVPVLFRDNGVPLSFIFTIAGTMVLMGWVAFNEYGHSFWQTEELFSTPIHAGFVIAFFIAFAVASVWMQSLPRIVDLIDELKAGKTVVPQSQTAGAD